MVLYRLMLGLLESLERSLPLTDFEVSRIGFSVEDSPKDTAESLAF